VDARPYADLIATSLTKYFSGVGDVMGGSLIFAPGSSLREELERAHAATHEDLLWWEDAVTLEHNSRDFVDRMRQINANTEALAEFLRGHARIERVYFPKYETPDTYAKARKNDAAYGGLFSILLKDGERAAPAVYDRLRVSKGPSLGTNYTLACPYTLLAHYAELDWAESIGVSRYLLRVSVGLEEVNDLKERFRDGLKSV
jgi:cystathionine gamma-synthase